MFIHNSYSEPGASQSAPFSYPFTHAQAYKLF